VRACALSESTSATGSAAHLVVSTPAANLRWRRRGFRLRC